MALIKCPECGNQISEYSFECPHCHYKNENRKDYHKIDVSEKNYEQKYFTYGSQIVKHRKRKPFIIIGVVIIVLAAIIIGIPVSNKYTINSEIVKTNENIEPYLAVMGTKVIDGKYNLSEEDYSNLVNGLDNVNIMGYLGTVNHQYSLTTYIITNTQWTLNNTVKEQDYDNYVKKLNSYLGSEAKQTHDDELNVDCLLWTDNKKNLDIESWYANEKIYIRWNLKDSN